jgi:hypothetical protein
LDVAYDGMGDKIDKTMPIFNYSLSLFDGESTVDVGRTSAAYAFYYFNNTSYPFEYFQEKSNLQRVTSGFYQYGFSSGATMIFTILNNQWIIATYGVWICMVFHSTFSRTRELGSYRGAAVNLAEAIAEDLEQISVHIQMENWSGSWRNCRVLRAILNIGVGMLRLIFEFHLRRKDP